MHSPPLYLPLPTPDEMTRWDRGAFELYGIPPLLLMENAAQAAVAVLKSALALSPAPRILVFAGKGNNGGDGIAVARILHDEGVAVRVLCTTRPDALPSPAKEHADMAMALGVPFYFSDELGNFPDLRPETEDVPQKIGASSFFDADAVVDALTGTGIRGDLRERELVLVRRINRYRGRSFILSLDIPSGLDGLTGKARPEAVRADATVCFEASKPGLHMPGASEYTGTLHLCRVGIPLALRTSVPASWRLIRPHKGAWAHPSPYSHKGSAGKVLIIGGNEGMAGAPLLAARGSLRAGAGLVHVALPGGLEPAARAALPEVLTHPFGKGLHWDEDVVDGLCSLLEQLRPDVLLIGPGMGRDDAVRNILYRLLSLKRRPPAVIDADALFFFRLGEEPVPNGEHGLIRLLEPQDVLTPHPGEMARLLPDSFFEQHACGQDKPEKTADNASVRIRLIQENRPDVLQRFTSACPSVLALKGAGTLVGRQGDPTALSPFSVATLAVGGSGDVLAGVCAALMTSEGGDSLDSACLAVHLHGRAGELLHARASRGHLAGEIADAIPLAMEELWTEEPCKH